MDGQSSLQRTRTGTRSSITPGRTGTVRQRQVDRGQSGYGWTVLLTEGKDRDKKLHDTRYRQGQSDKRTGRQGQSGYGWTVLSQDRDKKLHDTR